LIFFILIHIFACFWVIIANFTADENVQTWLDQDPRIQGHGHDVAYLVSVYFTVTTITTVGYGDVSFHTPVEMLFALFTMLVGVVAFSFASGSLASIL
jgi:voltage-gated potassium channel Kch